MRRVGNWEGWATSMRVGCGGGVRWKGEPGAGGGRRTERPHDLRQSRRERGGVKVAHRGAGHVLVARAV